MATLTYVSEKLTITVDEPTVKEFKLMEKLIATTTRKPYKKKNTNKLPSIISKKIKRKQDGTIDRRTFNRGKNTKNTSISSVKILN